MPRLLRLQGLAGFAALVAASCGGSSFSTTGSASSSSGAGAGGSGSVSATSSGAGGATTGTGGGGGGSACPDADGDGFPSCEGDCDDADANTHPNAIEVCGDARDNDCANGADDICNGIGTYVSSTGNDANPGTQEKPVLTIAKGMKNAAAIRASAKVPQSVYVAAGHYPEAVTMVEGVSLLGGYDPSSWARNVNANDTAILCPSDGCVRVPTGVTRATVLDGFRIEGTKTPAMGDSACIQVEGGAATISRNTIHAGAVGGDTRTFGVRLVPPISDPGPLIVGNVIQGATSGLGSAAILFDVSAEGVNGTTTADVHDNVIVGGSGSSPVGIAALSTAQGTRIASNAIFGGSATAPGMWSSWAIVATATLDIVGNRINVEPMKRGACADDAWCGGILSISATAKINNNVVFGAKALRSAAVMLIDTTGAGVVTLNGNDLDGAGYQIQQSSTSAAVVLRNDRAGISLLGRIRNNILRGGDGSSRYGLFEAQSKDDTLIAHPEFLDHDDFAPGMTALVHRYQGVQQPAFDLGTLAQLVGAGYTDNITADPMLDASFHLANGSPCIDAGTSTEAPQKDMDGDSRPVNGKWDIGADEHP